MSERIPPPPGASKLYVQLHDTALAFVDAQAQDAEHPLRMNFDRIQALLAPDFQHTWGHNHAVSLNPRLQGTHSFLLFTKHLEAMLPNLESWDTTVTDVVVDEVRRKVMLRLSMRMRVKGKGKVEAREVENDLLWALEMDKEGKIRRSTEFIDAVAAGRIKEIMGEQGSKSAEDVES